MVVKSVKMAISATLAIVTAQWFGLLNPASAGIIAILSLTDTKKSTVKIGLGRLLALGIATLIAGVFFHLIGYRALAFGAYLICFVPIALSFNLADAIPISSVLVTHYLLAQTVDRSMIINSYSLMLIGVGWALLFNLYMPSTDNRLQTLQLEIDTAISGLLASFAERLQGDDSQKQSASLLAELNAQLITAQKMALHHADNHLLQDTRYYIEYFTMRHKQVEAIESMCYLINEIEVADIAATPIVTILEKTSREFDAHNPVSELLNDLEVTFDFYEQSPLPKTRSEFESRAKLYQFMTEFHHLLEAKAIFMQQQTDVKSV
ncbi:aromatic acid exporter family protein [Vagococcus lutrae]|uniref:aromatic acid exporter family protein n=1 Tax=Vagococcus lutrae TaxID=81947 RepID=UPI001928FE38|nr:aromatic acid exporter family protein [Vagococcus lutrae]QZN89293.1 aromatic acid exporter family protein [Vagococcus lutrae]UQF23737.1 aromatic acid exporter family protein [Vagococcus lutrae]UQF64173.1 aromatic acid exporter family protein [Vagococcus lutrae]GEQ60823.1 membrane protein [Vagococcus lutrae]GEQ62717.1 membrane protein [Vagococcus lutrae]